MKIAIRRVTNAGEMKYRVGQSGESDTLCQESPFLARSCPRCPDAQPKMLGRRDSSVAEVGSIQRQLLIILLRYLERP